MKKIKHKILTITKKSTESIKTDGLAGFAKRSAQYAYYKQFPEKKKKQFKDILFINGCALPHPERFRVDHQTEQLQAGGMTVDKIFYEELSLDMLPYYRGFIFFRCPVTDTVNDFIKFAKKYNKACFYDVDDLVIDTKYTDKIKYVKNMSASEKSLYDDGINRMQKTLLLCDYAITTTDRLKVELEKYTKEVFINRNVASDEMVSTSKSVLRKKNDDNKIVIGYFSGSITHNEDFEIVLPSLIKLFEKYNNLHLKIVGILDIPIELEPYKKRVINIDFMDWRTMPTEIASCDINIAPLTTSIFNEAKSENKWTEASLVKVVTVASNVGALKDTIKHEKTGILTDDSSWFEVLDDLINNPEKREKIAQFAHKEVINRTTIQTSSNLTNYINSKLSKNIGFVLPTTDISGGVNVVLKHAQTLQKYGWDVTLIDTVDKNTHKKSRETYDYRDTIPGLNVITLYKTNAEAYFDTLVATLWSTLKYVKEYPNVKNKLYFVQSMETDFYPPGSTPLRTEANATYNDKTGVRYITMSLWCQKWLKEKFDKKSKYASNGIDLKYYPVRERKFDPSDKIRILVEGDSRNKYKNTDEAFRIVEKLDPNKYEVSYLSYRKEPKDWYKVDHFYNRIPAEKVGEVYAGCDILIKTSLLESFSYPPLEIMATGGLSVVVPNEGNVEYLRDGENCLFYKQGDIEDGVKKVERLVKDKELRNRLIKNGLETAKSLDWKNIDRDIISLYE